MDTRILIVVDEVSTRLHEEIQRINEVEYEIEGTQYVRRTVQILELRETEITFQVSEDQRAPLLWVPRR